MAIFEGAGVALVTPFDDNNKVDYDILAKMLERQVEGNSDAIIVCGTTGEPATMSEEERLSVISFTVEKINNRIPVIAGTGTNSTQAVVDFSKKVEKLGVDALLVVSPFYNKATQKGLYEHYSMIADSVSLPIIMYNVPSRTGCNILPETAVKLGKDKENIVGIKEASQNMTQIAKLSKLVREENNCLDIYSGNDDQIVPILSLGGKGVISVLSNVVPKQTHDMVAKYIAGDVEGALELQLKYLDLIDDLFCEVNPIPVKMAMHLLGIGNGKMRLPLTILEEEHRIILEKEMKKLNII